MKPFQCLLMITATLFSIASCDSSSSTKKNKDWSCSLPTQNSGQRVIGVDLLDASETGSFDDSIKKAKEFNTSFTGLHMSWTQIETSPSTFVDPDNTLSSLSTYLAANDLKLSLTIRPIDLTGKTVPSDLSSARFNSTEMKTRFKALIDFIFTKVDPDLLTSLQIGNEIDHYDTSTENVNFWSDYGDFLFEMNAYIDSNYPNVSTGFTVTLMGLKNGPHKSSGVFEALAATVDVVGVTYYPNDNNFSVLPVDSAGKDLAFISDMFSGNTIYLQEVGYQSAASNDSSELKQAQFMCHFFSAWDKHQSQIPLVIFVRLNDISKAKALELSGPYGLNDKAFLEYLRTLGLRSYEDKGKDKQVFKVLVEQSHLRGF